MPRLSSMLAVEVGNPNTSQNADNHTEVQQSTAPQTTIVQSTSNLVYALAAFFIVIFILHKVENWAKRGI